MILLSTPWWADQAVLSLILSAIGIIVAFIAIIVTIIIYYKQRTRYELTYKVHSDSPVGPIDEQSENNIQVRYEESSLNHPSHNANLVNLEVSNSGTKDVEIENATEVDLDERKRVPPITFTFSGRRVIRVTQLKTDPANEDIIREQNRIAYVRNPSPKPDSIGLPNSFLKPHQSIILSVLLDGPEGKVDGKGYTKERTELKSYEKVEQKKAHRRRLILSVLFSAGAILLLFSSLSFILNGLQTFWITYITPLPLEIQVR
jgi:hypothetical protein